MTNTTNHDRRCDSDLCHPDCVVRRQAERAEMRYLKVCGAVFVVIVVLAVGVGSWMFLNREPTPEERQQAFLRAAEVAQLPSLVQVREFTNDRGDVFRTGCIPGSELRMVWYRYDEFTTSYDPTCKGAR